ncbi:hypothetical protein AMAG_20779 [Allomyces macrogynus ATCC 38327]|uniref:ubiquitinyl hydrolase 1 n=1 Tax=Allomyces macrogynus (strain ATCC 38327) TaxID=578462 RepID=A0A0L0TFK6_ALLM3|nr:hypothetical protein AMAG_20779 [Allomyces macrogynus ATCC 38327]|eukprot:KNE73399.1 hypothetical protein AMAG_20779 [Allomyces macrogynus ATCC 38327]
MSVVSPLRPDAAAAARHGSAPLTRPSTDVFWRILLGFGARGLWIRDVYFPKPVDFLRDHLFSLAVIFCFPLVDAASAAEMHEFHGPNPPASLFFANQVINNACASQAILHAIYNLTAMSNGYELGDLLTLFRDFTADMSPSVRFAFSLLGRVPWTVVADSHLLSGMPKIRGVCISNSPALHRVHNSFGRYASSSSCSSARATKVYRTRAVADEEPCAPLDDRAFHYTAFIPYDGHVWELDGLLPRPKYIGPIREGETWHSVVMEHIDLRMEQYDPDDQRCNVMSLEVDPLLKSNATMAEIEQRIAAMRNGTALSVPSPPPVLATTASAEPAAKRARKGQHGATAEPMDVDVPTQGQQGVRH